MAADLMERGVCSACGHGAERATSGRWWHDPPGPCRNRSQMVFPVVGTYPLRGGGYGIRRLAADEGPARFVPESARR